jgi:predicted transcriptional regulator
MALATKLRLRKFRRCSGDWRRHHIVAGMRENSSRSGIRTIDALLRRGLVIRDEKGRINLTDQGSSFAA